MRRATRKLHPPTLTTRWLIAAVGPPGIAEPEIGQNGLAGDGGLAFRHQRARSLGEINVEARAETDQPEALTRADRLPFPHERHDAPCHEAGDLGHPDASIRGRDDQRIALVVLARLVEFGVDELARAIGDAIDSSRDRTAIHMAVEYAHEDGNALQRPVAKSELGRRQDARDHRDPPAGRRHTEPLAPRRP